MNSKTRRENQSAFRASPATRLLKWHDAGTPVCDPDIEEEPMRYFLFAFITAACFPVAPMAQERINPTDPQPTCSMCPGTLVPHAELEAYREKAIAEKLVDQQVRDIDIGKAHIGIGMVYRGKLDKPRPDSVAEHDQVSEVYHIISGSATLVLGPDIANRQRRPATLRTVVEFNGPGNNGSEIRNGVAHQIKAGDVVVIPAGTGHWFTKIDDHISYLMVRIDPDKVTPLKGEAQSRDYLSKPARK
jgi:mannose-6-phosphate isomerase-like protein (cupin superfamily)